MKEEWKKKKRFYEKNESTEEGIEKLQVNEKRKVKKNKMKSYDKKKEIVKWAKDTEKKYNG